MAGLIVHAFLSLKWRKWGPNIEPKLEEKSQWGPFPQMGTYVGAASIRFVPLYSLNCALYSVHPFKLIDLFLPISMLIRL